MAAKKLRRPLPATPAVSNADLRVLEAPKVSGKGTSTGFKFVYERGTKPKAGNKCSEVCRTLRVRLKKLPNAAGKEVYEEYSGGWENARDAATFVVGLLKLRYGERWADAVQPGARREFFVSRDPDQYWKFWVTVVLDGRRVPLDNPREEEGFFWYPKHAEWFVRAWCNAKYPVSGPSALGFDPVPADAVTDAEALANLPPTPGRWRYHWLPMFDGVGE